MNEPLKPTVFESIIAGAPQGEAEYEELKRTFTLPGEEDVRHDVLRLRKRRHDWHEEQKAWLGVEPYSKVLRGLHQLVTATKPKIDAALNDGLARGATKCIPRTSDGALLLRFYGNGQTWNKKIGYKRAMASLGIPDTWSLAAWIEIQSYVLNFEGFSRKR